MRTASVFPIDLLILAASALLAALLGSNLQAEEPEDIHFDQDVAPVLITRCLECHQAREAAGELVLATADGLKRGGASGAAVQVGNASTSLLMQRLESGEMPPPKKGHSSKIPDREIAVLRRWIDAGAVWPDGRKLDLYERTTSVRAGRDWWSLQPVVRVTPPVPPPGYRTANPVDAFIAQRLLANRLEMASAADARTLMRRLYADLIGLPPTAAELDAFAADTSARAYQQLVDRLLSSPQYGERWARYWLDLVRFAETSGYERDQVKLHAWRYRDWVVNAFNSDYPYNRFVLDQLCGDALPERTIETVIATGFLRLGTWNDEPNDPEEYKYDRLEDMVDATCSVFLGLTVKCARCHDHKFDPIEQTDYYRVANAFWTGPIEARDPKWLGGPSAEELGFEVLGWTDLRRKVPPLQVLKKGDPRRPLQPVDANPVSFLPASARPPVSSPAGNGATRRRSEFAELIVDSSNPLTARVIVNRLWQHHFGHGLVRTPSNFGFTGDQPTHPELLDWLANELVDSGWSLKHIHRLLVLSETYRQASQHGQQAAYENRDPENRWWWRAERRRLDAESLRDSMLAVSDEIDLRVGGPSFRPTISPEALEGLSRKASAWQASPALEQRRRSLYIFTQRSLLPPLMTTFDFADTTLPCPQRDVTIAAPQALTLFNNEFVHARSSAIATRIASLGVAKPAERARMAWQLILGRLPTDQEITAASAHLATQASRFSGLNQSELPGGDAQTASLASLCHVLLNTNEFVFVD